MTLLVASIVVWIIALTIGVVAGSYIGYFIGMIYSLLNGWMFSVNHTTIASVFGVLGGLAGMAVVTTAWLTAYKELKREDDK